MMSLLDHIPVHEVERKTSCCFDVLVSMPLHRMRAHDKSQAWWISPYVDHRIEYGQVGLAILICRTDQKRTAHARSRIHQVDAIVFFQAQYLLMIQNCQVSFLKVDRMYYYTKRKL